MNGAILMSDDSVNITVTPTCPKCGHHGIIIPDNPTDESIITSEACAANLGTHAQLNDGIRNAACICFSPRPSLSFAIKRKIKIRYQ
jgi:hypothetical protein